ncbi:hypothetical protein E2C01_099755 [Portunus trituberculatus]|uniref:Uncharacterized protein n=1 Tax=Portunus trituberculatus TaxID=210409 RepID=A0A5B7KHM6_PORTR|nr:hypothetical protein [Portunus trituberculatus]
MEEGQEGLGGMWKGNGGVGLDGGWWWYSMRLRGHVTHKRENSHGRLFPLSKPNNTEKEDGK